MSYTETVYDFKIYPIGLSEKIWRRIYIGAQAALSDFCCAALASMQMEPGPSFAVAAAGQLYSFPRGCGGCGSLDSGDYSISDAVEDISDKMEITCGEWVFEAVLCNIFQPESMSDRRLPEIVSGAGQGIIADIPPEELLALIRATDSSGAAQAVDVNCVGKKYIWDYRDFDLAAQNRYLHDKLT